MSGSSILSTISFILLIMASPQVAGQATSSNEFGYLNAVVEDATHIIYEAQAWAEGMRGSEPVYGNNTFVPEKESEVITSLSVDETSFKQKVGERPGLKRIFEFTYNQDETWGLITTTYEGNTSTQSTPEVIGNLLDYGITIGLRGGADAPDPGDKIKVTIEEADNTFENNAKYYAEQAQASQQAIEDLTATGEKVQAEEFNANNNYQIGDYVWYDTLVNNAYQSLLYRFISVHTAGTPWNTSEVIEEILINKTIENDIVNFHFKMPQGPRGDVNFLTFDINIDTGNLIMYRPDNISPQVNFSLNNNDGNLYIEIAN